MSNAENQPTGHGPYRWLEKGPSASLFVRYVPLHFPMVVRFPLRHRKNGARCSSLTPRIQTLLKPTVGLLLMIRCTSMVLRLLAGSWRHCVNPPQYRWPKSFLFCPGGSGKNGTARMLTYDRKTHLLRRPRSGRRFSLFRKEPRHWLRSGGVREEPPGRSS